jgi:hypothetical protein
MKTVIIRRLEVLNHLPKEIRAGAKIKIGSIYVNRQPLKGLDGEEENRILSKVIDVPPGHEKWPEKTKDFWASLNLKVPFEGVVSLEYMFIDLRSSLEEALISLGTLF